MPSIIAMSIWQGLGVNVIIFLAALQAIPSELLDAASVDGAGRWARFRHVTLPLLTPAVFFTGVLALIAGFQVFDQIFVLIKPRPTDATITVVYFIYENGFKFFKMGYASAASWVLFRSWPSSRRSTSGRRAAGCTTSERRRRHPPERSGATPPALAAARPGEPP